MDEATFGQHLAALKAQVMILDSLATTTNDCWKVCVKDKTFSSNSLSKTEKECIHQCALASLQADVTLDKRTTQHMQSHQQ